MVQKQSKDEMISILIENIEISDKKDKIISYIGEVMKNCVALCDKDEHIRVLNEIEFMMENLRQTFDL